LVGRRLAPPAAVLPILSPLSAHFLRSLTHIEHT
jgi:hypothetical protein